MEFSYIHPDSFPQFSKNKIHEYLENIKTKKSTVLGDIPARIIKECAHHLCIPVRDIINKSIIAGQWAKIYKKKRQLPQFQKSSHLKK